MCNVGTKEGVTVKDNRFASVWPTVEMFFRALRAQGAVIGVAIDPLTSHECGNQRYLAIPWLDACLAARLPARNGEPLRPMAAADAFLTPLSVDGSEPVAPVPAAKFTGALGQSIWLPNAAIAQSWLEYVRNTAVTDVTPPPPPQNVRVNGNELTWTAAADLESGLAHFIIERDGVFLANVPERGKNSFGRPIFQNLQYSDTPTQPLVAMQFTDTTAEPEKTHHYRVIAVNTAGLKSN
jgi:hypothetical protein